MPARTPLRRAPRDLRPGEPSGNVFARQADNFDVQAIEPGLTTIGRHRCRPPIRLSGLSCCFSLYYFVLEFPQRPSFAPRPYQCVGTFGKSRGPLDHRRVCSDV